MALFLLDGTVRDGAGGTAGPGESPGLVARADALFDVLADHATFGLAMLQVLATNLLDGRAMARRPEQI